MRILTAAEDMAAREAIVDGLWPLIYGQGTAEVLSDGSRLLDCLESVGLSESEARALVERAGTEEVSEALEANTAKAVRVGAFGTPTMVVSQDGGETEFFFGSDRLHHIAQFLKVSEEPLLPKSRY